MLKRGLGCCIFLHWLYRATFCILQEEGCSFFDWCDAGPTGGGQFVAQPRQGDPSPSPFPEAGSDAASQPPLECPCGEGLCSVLTAKTEKNMGRMFYRCPKSQVLWRFYVAQFVCSLLIGSVCHNHEMLVLPGYLQLLQMVR